MLIRLCKNVYVCERMCRKGDGGEGTSGRRRCMCTGLNRRQNVTYLRQWKKTLWFNYKACISGDKAGEGVILRALELYPKTRGTYWITLGKETAQSNLCFRKPTMLLQGEWTELHPILPGQQQFKALRSSRAPVAAIATRKSVVLLGQIPDATAPKSIQAQPLYGSDGCCVNAGYSESWCWHRGFSTQRRKWYHTSVSLLGGPHSRSYTSLGCRAVKQFT